MSTCVIRANKVGGTQLHWLHISWLNAEWLQTVFGGIVLTALGWIVKELRNGVGWYKRVDQEVKAFAADRMTIHGTLQGISDHLKTQDEGTVQVAKALEKHQSDVERHWEDLGTRMSTFEKQMNSRMETVESRMGELEKTMQVIAKNGSHEGPTR